MSKTYALRTALHLELKSLCGNCYYEENTSNPIVYPYIVYDISQVGENYQVEINVMDYALSSKVVEDLTDSIDLHFKNFIHRDTAQVFRTFMNTRNNIKEDDIKLKRRRLLIDLYYNGRE